MRTVSRIGSSAWSMLAMIPLLTLLVVTLTATSGCYYAHLAGGQARVMWARRDVEDVVTDPTTPPELRERLQLVDRAREYARELGLEVEGQYTSYVPWPGDRIVTSLIVTEPGSIDARPFSFPILGEVPYKGYFDADRARRDADSFEADGLDTCLVSVPAYSTLGWFDDPVTDPMFRAGDGPLVETVIHELVHATVFIKSEPDFNEGAANFIGEEGSVRLFERDDAEISARRRTEISDDRRIAAALMDVRDRVAALYQEPLGPEARAVQRAALERDARAELAALDLTTRNAALLAERVRLGDACLALRGAYVQDTAHHQAVLDALDGDLGAFVARLIEAGEADDPRSTFFALDAPSLSR